MVFNILLSVLNYLHLISFILFSLIQLVLARRAPVRRRAVRQTLRLYFLYALIPRKREIRFINMLFVYFIYYYLTFFNGLTV